MAVLDDPPTPDIIKRLKRRLDFYNVNGQWRVRRWPTFNPRTQNPLEILAQDHLGAALSVYRCTPEYMRDAYATLTSGMYWTRRDYFYKHWFGTIDPYDATAWGHHPPQPVDPSIGSDHYWALVGDSAHTFSRWYWQLRLYFTSDLYYKLHYTRTPPRNFTIQETRRGQICLMGRRIPSLWHDMSVLPISLLGDGRAYIQMSCFPGSPQIGRYWGYVTGEHLATHHPALSLSPWFHFEVPEGPFPLHSRAVESAWYDRSALEGRFYSYPQYRTELTGQQGWDCIRS